MKTLFFLLFVSIGLSLHGQDGQFYYKKAQEQFAQNNYSEALVLINKAEKLNKSGYVLALKGVILSRLRHCSEAKEYGKRALEKGPGKYWNFDSYGNILINCGKPHLAVPYFDKAIQLVDNDEDRVRYLMNRSAAKAQYMDFQGSYDDAATALAIDSTNLGALSNLAAVCDEVGRGDETLFYLLKAIEVDSMFLPAYINIGFKYQVEGEYEKSNEYFAKAIEIDPNDAAFAYSNRSYNKLKLNDLNGAMDDINQSIKLLYNNSYAYRNRALIWLAKGKKKKACEDLNTAIKYGFSQRYGDEVEKLLKEHCDR